MPRGGYRPNSGRPKGARNKVPSAATIREAAAISNETPLAYMLRIMNDTEADPLRRDKMAAMAAPFVHARADVLGKKERQALVAEDCEVGSDWESLLQRVQ